MSSNKYDIAVLGAGESGVWSAVLAQKKGFKPFLSDSGAIKEKAVLEQNKIDFEENGHTEQIILSAKEIIKSPGIPDKAPIIKKARELGIPVISEIEFASRFYQGKIIAISGSNGKTTTTSLIYHILKNANKNVGLGGNIGKSFARLILEGSFDAVVLELSSFQLDGIDKFKANIAVLLNITPDHLDRYDYKFENYIDSKLRISRNQTPDDVFIYWDGDTNIVNKLNQVEAKKIAFNMNSSLHKTPLKIKGNHNVLNANAAFLACKHFGLSDAEISRGLESFEPIKHRLQKIATINGVDYINDSKATNVDSVKYALESFSQPLVWIAGGVDKGNDYSELTPFLKNIHTLICLGVDNEKLKTYFKPSITNILEANSMNLALSLAYKNAQKGDAVLLSPACASFDLFKNYEDRGDQFISEVLKLKENK